MTTVAAGRPGEPDGTSTFTGSGGGSPAAGVRGEGDSRLRLRRNPVRLACSTAPWSAAGYLATYVAVSWVLFSVALTAATTAAAFAITLAGIPLLVAAAGVVRGCANLQRGMLRQVFAQSVQGGYRQVTQPGILAQLRTRWRDGATWRDLACLIGLWAPLYALDTIVLSVWATFLAGVTLPLWYWAPRSNIGIGYVNLNGVQAHGVTLGYFPHGPRGSGAVGLYVDSLPRALLAAAVFLILFLIFNYALVLTALAHARIARSLLRARADPLAAAKEVLARPGPLGPPRNHVQNGIVRASREP
jgi:hypothetical protein